MANIYKNDDFIDLRQKQNVSKEFGHYYMAMAYDDDYITAETRTFRIDDKKIDKMVKLRREKFVKKSYRMQDCMSYMLWDKYDKNKLLDLKRVSRCKDRFCPNCNKLTISKAINDFAPYFEKLMQDGSMPYMMTLTVPNVDASDLKHTIWRMQKAFSKMWQWLYREENDRKAFKHRFTRFNSAIRALEVTYNRKTHQYHPHLHVMLFSDNLDNEYLVKKHSGYWQNKTNSYRLISDMDLQTMKLWRLAYNDTSIKRYPKLPDELFDDNGQLNYYMADFTELSMPKGIYEVFKYTFKSADIDNYNQFKTIHDALSGKRIRQTYGQLYNLNLEDNDIEFSKDLTDPIELYLKENEAPKDLNINDISYLWTTYDKYKKISRFNYNMNLNKID